MFPVITAFLPVGPLRLRANNPFTPAGLAAFRGPKKNNAMKIVKNIILFSLGLLAVACGKQPAQSVPAERINVVFRALTPSTKSVADDETNIVTLDALAFRTDGRLDSYARMAGEEITLSVTKGQSLSWWVVANAPEHALDGIATEDALNDLVSSLTDNASDALLMTGRGSGTYSGATQSVAVALTRHVSKVSIGKLTASFLGTGEMSSATMTLDAVYLVNACGTVKYNLTPVAETWYNRLALDGTLSAPVKAFLWEDGGARVLSSSTAVLDMFFYACPNPTDNGRIFSTDPVWSPRNTRLVLETSIDGVKNYYPVTLPSMRCNYEYRIEEVELLGFGSASPDTPVVREGMKWSVVVNSWGTEEINRTLE